MQILSLNQPISTHFEMFYLLMETELFCWFQLFRGRTASFSDREKSVGFIITAGATALLGKSLPFHTWLRTPQETFRTSQKNIHCFRYKTQDRIHNCLFSAVHSYRLGFYFLFCFLHCICSSIEENAKISFFRRQNHCYSSKHALARVRKASPISGFFDWWLVTAAWFLQGLSLKITVIRRLDSDLMWSIPLSGGPLDICYK